MFFRACRRGAIPVVLMPDLRPDWAILQLFRGSSWNISAKNAFSLGRREPWCRVTEASQLYHLNRSIKMAKNKTGYHRASLTQGAGIKVPMTGGSPGGNKFKQIPGSDLGGGSIREVRAGAEGGDERFMTDDQYGKNVPAGQVRGVVSTSPGGESRFFPQERGSAANSVYGSAAKTHAGIVPGAEPVSPSSIAPQGVQPNLARMQPIPMNPIGGSDEKNLANPNSR